MSVQRRWLPREGFTADVVGSIIRQTALNPTLTIPALLLARFWSRARDLALAHPTLYSTIRNFAILGVIRVINAYLNRRVLNNGVVDKYNWSKEVVVVTGGSDGIGKQVTLMLAGRGIRVAVLDVQPLTYHAPQSVAFFSCDITSTPAVSAAASEIRSTLGEPTVLVNNAGVCRGKPLLENTDDDIRFTFDVNTLSHYRLAKEFVPSMIRNNHGMVVTVASAASWVTAPRMTEYASSKAAALAFHEGLAAELVAVHKATKVRTVVVNQGYTKTSLFQGFGVNNAFLSPALHVDTVAEAIVNQILSGESGQIICPGFNKLFAAHFRSLPTWMQVDARSKMDDLMRNWKGRQVIQSKSH